MKKSNSIMDGGGSEWDEGKHNRDSDGKFAAKGNGDTPAEIDRADEIVGITKESRKDAQSLKGKNKTESEFFGNEYRDFKGAEAIEKLLTEKQGHIKNAFERKELGGINVVWGDESAGIAHIIQRREKQNIDGIALVRKIPEIISNGSFGYDKNRDRFNIEYNENRIVIKPTYDGEKVMWIMTAMEIKKPLEN